MQLRQAPRARAPAAALRLVAGLLAAAAPAQGDGWRALGAGHWLRAVPVADCRAQAVAVAWPHAFCADAGHEKALARALAEQRQMQVTAVLPGAARASCEVFDGVTLFQLLLPAGDADTAARWLAALAAPAVPGRDDDALALALARAALAADDAQWLFPGQVLASRARKALLAGASGGSALWGPPEFLQACTPQALARAMRDGPGGPVRAVVVGSAAGVDALGAALAALPAPGMAPTAARPLAPAEAAFSPHPRVDGPFVAAAVAAPAPGAAGLLFAVGAEVLRARAALRFGQYRGQELLALAPFLSYSLLAGDPVLILYRRGPDLADVGRPRQELAELLAEARSRPVSAHEAAAAVRLLQSELAVPPWTPAQTAAWAGNPDGLPPRARALALLGHWQVADAAVAGLIPDAAAVQQLLQAALAEDRVWWGGLAPVPPKPWPP